MITIVEPKEHIDKLWGKQIVREGETYRMMRYVLRVDHEDKVLLHNVVTGRLVVLEREEAETLANLPAAFSPVMEQLVTEHYLVPERYDEHQQVVNLRTILRKLDDVQRPKDIKRYTILPTTACNARCYYCFEKGIKNVTMSEKTANDVVEYISKHCGEKKGVIVSWFGGEPTVASHRIDQICEGLKRQDISFRSEMTTNGYLFDEELVDQAKNLWNLVSVMICVDGTEENYNRIKSYVGVSDNPYQRVMRNVRLLLDKEIRVNFRMNFDLNNYHDFPALAQEALERFHHSPSFMFTVHPVIGEHVNPDGKIMHGSDEWFRSKILELHSLVREAGLQNKEKGLPCLEYLGCEANSDNAVTITAEGNIVRCPEQIGEDQTTGTVVEGITLPERILLWKKFAEYEKCKNCVLYPKCDRLVNCSAGDRCNYFPTTIQIINESVKIKYQRMITQESF